MKRKFCGFLLIVLLAGLLPASAAGQQAGEAAPGGPPAQGATAEQPPAGTAPRLAAQAGLLPPLPTYMLQEVIQVPANGSPCHLGYDPGRRRQLPVARFRYDCHRGGRGQCLPG
jgi:hypothetical protein